MHHDVQLRADARAIYDAQLHWVDQPSFEEAERLHLDSYLSAVGQAREDRIWGAEANLAGRQMALL